MNTLKETLLRLWLADQHIFAIITWPTEKGRWEMEFGHQRTLVHDNNGASPHCGHDVLYNWQYWNTLLAICWGKGLDTYLVTLLHDDSKSSQNLRINMT